MRVGLLVWAGPNVTRSWPSHVRGRAVSQLVSTIDIAPTILEAAGEQPPPDWDGESLLHLLQGEQAAAHRGSGLKQLRRGEFVLGGAEERFPMRSIRTRRWLYIHNALHASQRPTGTSDYYHGKSGSMVTYMRDTSLCSRWYERLSRVHLCGQRAKRFFNLSYTHRM